MTHNIIDGKEVAKAIREELKTDVKKLSEKGITPHLSVIIIGDDPASHSYVNGKEKASREVGIESEVFRLPEDTSEADLLEKIDQLNKENHVHGILVQLPLPEHIDEQKVIEAISPSKDVDGFHPINVGNMLIGQKAFLPCTPHGIVKMLEFKDVEIEGKHVVVVGRSNIVGKPMGQLLLNKNATVTYCHSRTNDLKKWTQEADILIVAVGREHFIDGSYVKDGAVVIDVGVNRTKEGKLTGDVDFESAKEKASLITPVPGGVGPMTITMLLANTVDAAKGELD